MKHSLLVVDLGDICMGPMFAAVLARKRTQIPGYEPENIVIESAGVFQSAELCNRPAEKNAVLLFPEFLADHRSRQAVQLDLDAYYQILALNPCIRDSLMNLGVKYERIKVVVQGSQGLPNVIGRAMAEYQDVARRMEALATALLPHLTVPSSAELASSV